MITNHPFSLEGQRIAITGAGGGIGSAAARFAATLGAELILVDLRPPSDVAEQIKATGAQAQAGALDVTDRGAVESWVKDCGRLDALIDCAAICPFDEWHQQGWDAVADQVFNVNLHGPLNLVRSCMDSMRDTGGGRIALVGSIAGRIGGLMAAPHYVMSKGAIHSFVRWASRKGAADGILVNAVAPGPVETPMTQGAPFDNDMVLFNRMATAEEIAGPLVFLVSPTASYISGAVLDINGAMHFS